MPGSSTIHHDTTIRTQELTKHYGDVRAVDNLSLDVRRGEIYGFLGRNGAGKTTTIRMLLGLVKPTSGQATILDRRIAPGHAGIFSRVGYLVETATAYGNLTVRENLDMQRRLTGATGRSKDEVMDLLGISVIADGRTGHLSLGNKQRLSLARALLHKPDVLLLDEPANGLDPAGIIEVRELLRQLADNSGVTVFMSSHILAEVAHLADRIGIIHEGRLLEELDYDELQAKSREYLDITVSDPDQAAVLIRDKMGLELPEETSEGDLRLFEGFNRAPEIARLLVEAGFELQRLAPAQEDLESYFIRLTEGEK